MADGIIFRPDDLLVLGLSWSGMECVASSPGGPPELAAVAEGARLVVMLPPQHLAERPSAWKWWDTQWISLKGSLPPGSPVAAVAPKRHITSSTAVFEHVDLFLVGDDGTPRFNRWKQAWLNDDPDPIGIGFRFPPGTPITTLAPDDAEWEAYAVDGDGTLNFMDSFVDDAQEQQPTGWGPVDGGSLEASEFQPGAPLEAAHTNGETNVFAIRADTLMHWRNGRGLEAVRTLPVGARVKAFGLDFFTAVVVSVHDDGQPIVDWWDGSQWRNQFLPTPPTAVSLATAAEAVVSSEGTLVFVVADDGVLYGMSMSLDTSQQAWLTGEWQGISSNLVPGTRVSALADAFADAFKHLVVAVDGDGVAWATSFVFPFGEMDPPREEQIGDWFPAGAPVTLVNRGGVIEAFAVGSDRAVRHARREGEGWSSSRPDAVPIRTYGREPANLAGPSQVSFEVPRGTRIPLTAEGVLAAMRAWPLVPWPASFADAALDETIIELPWGLYISPDPAGRSVADHRERPAVSPAGVVETWHTRISAEANRGQRPGASAIRALCAKVDPGPEAGEPFAPPLNQLQREEIVRNGTDLVFSGDRMILSPLGGWLSASGSWPSLEWEHEAVCGRDITVRTVQRGVLYPFGNAATYEELTRRRFDPRSDRSVAVLHRQGALHIAEPVRRYAPEEQSRLFPFAEAEIATTSVTYLDLPFWEGAALGDDPLESFFFRPRIHGQPVLFPVVLRNEGGEVPARLPALFVRNTAVDSSFSGVPPLDELGTAYASADSGPVPGAPVRLAGTQSFEVHELQLQGVHASRADSGGGFVPRIAGLRIGLPAVRELTNEVQVYKVAFSKAYEESGLTERLFDVTEGTIDVSFAGKSDRAGGLATPSFVGDAISGAGGPINAAALGPGFDPRTLFSDQAKLLGIVSLRDVVKQLPGAVPPAIETHVDGPPKASFEWRDVELAASPPLSAIAGRSAKLDLAVEATTVRGGQPRVRTTGSLTNFCLDLAGVLVVSFDALRFATVPDEKPSLGVCGLDIRFAGDLEFLAVLQDAARELTGEVPVAIEATPRGVTASHHVGLPPLTLGAGAFSVSVRDAVFHASVELPFDGEVGVDLGFGSRKHPFLVGVWILGGGGYLELKVRHGTVTELVAAVEIGGLWSVDWVVVAGELHALAGIEIRLASGRAVLSGYLRVGGSVELLGLVSVSIEVSAAITATLDPLRVEASARIVVEVDLFLLSTGVDLEKTIVLYDAAEPTTLEEPPPAEDSGRFADERATRTPGRRARERVHAEDARDAWAEHRAAFAPERVA